MVFVFKTSVRTKKAIKILTPKLDEILAQSRWNFDMEDRDKILRIESKSELCEQVIKLLNDNGFDCAELID